MKTAHVLSLAVALLFCSAARAEDRVTVAPVAPVSVRMGQSSPFQIKLHVQPGFHINSNKPATPELIPTQISFTPPEDLAIAKVKYPPGVMMSLPFDPSTKLSVYSGDVIVSAVALPTPKAAAGTYTVHAEVRYQACDNNACYPPKRLPISFDVKIGSGGGARRTPRIR